MTKMASTSSDIFNAMNTEVANEVTALIFGKCKRPIAGLSTALLSYLTVLVAATDPQDAIELYQNLSVLGETFLKKMFESGEDGIVKPDNMRLN